MANKSGSRTGTIMTVFVLIVVAAILPWQSILGTTNGDNRVVDFTVAFSPTSRSVDQSISVVIQVGPNKTKAPVQESPWTYTQVVAPGTIVSVHATQVSPGAVSCRIKVNGQDRAHDVSQDLQPAACATKV